MKRITVLLLVSTLICILVVWTGDIVESASAASIYQSGATLYNGNDGSPSGNSSNMPKITLKGNSITFDGDGAIVDDSKIRITSSGTYYISGKLNNGQIIVNTKDKEAVNLVLNGVDITCFKGAPLYVINAAKTVITLPDGAKNYITDSNSYIPDDEELDEPNAAIFSDDDLTITGKGSLTIKANYNGIQTKDDLEIRGGNIAVNAVNDGIKGKDSVAVKDGNMIINAGGDGMQSNKIEDPDKGYVSIEGGTIKITAGRDGIQAETNLTISGGSITISSGVISDSDTNKKGTTTTGYGRASVSTKGIKAGVDLIITGGTINIDSVDDSIHSKNSIKINGGKMTLASGNDGIGSTSSIEINGGDIDITKSYEGIESTVITINNGNIHLVSRNDGINAFGYSSGVYGLNINGGYIVVDAYGDGIDINGYINMTGGMVIVSGPTSNWNGPLDYYSFDITGGFIVASGSSGMAQPVGYGKSSTQYSVMIRLSWQEPGTMLHIKDEDGKEILTISPKKAYSSVAFCSPELQKDSTYTVYLGGCSTGESTDGLYSGGIYTPGEQVASFKISNAITYAR